MTNFIEYNTDDMVNEFAAGINYDEQGRVDALFYHMDYAAAGNKTAQLTHFYLHDYNSDGAISYYMVQTDVTNGEINYTYDALNRLTVKKYDFYLSNDTSKRFTNNITYGYDNIGDSTSGRISATISEVNGNTSAICRYLYDQNGNITHITNNEWEVQQKYTYDDLGQLIREDNRALGYSYEYTYDNAGNITSKKRYAFTLGELGTFYTTYSYGYGDQTWGDLLTSYSYMPIIYDDIGNPLTYYNGSSYTFTWKDGRRLATATKGSNTLAFEYDDNGIRTSKTVNGVKHTYYLSGSQIIAEEWSGHLCVYLYDAEGSPIGMQYRSIGMTENTFETYWFEKNLQGDIVAIYNMSGAKIRSYAYDAWGNVTETVYSSSGMNYYATYNPFKYRGYYMDSETGLYYLQSRYYDPATGRFINADGQLNDGLLGHNMFAYCGNNPVMNIDPDGHAWWHWALAAAVVVACAAATVVTCGGFAAAAGAVCMVASGTAAGTLAATVAAGAFIASATALGTVALCAAANSSSVDDFMEQGSFDTVSYVAFSAITGEIAGYNMYQAVNPYNFSYPNSQADSILPSTNAK